MIDGDHTSRRDVKEVHYQNLWEMVNYCENATDCRRVLQLQVLKNVKSHTFFKYIGIFIVHTYLYFNVYL